MITVPPFTGMLLASRALEGAAAAAETGITVLGISLALYGYWTLAVAARQERRCNRMR